MVDTVSLSFTDFEINLKKICEAEGKNRISAGLKKASQSTDSMIQGIDNQPLLFVDKEGIPCNGSGYYINAIQENFNIDIYPGRATARFSVPKVLTGKNYYTASGLETLQALKTVENKLSEIGMKTSLQTADITRIDLTKTVETDYSFKNYIPILAMLEGKRATDKRQYQAETLQWGNTQLQVCCYDKIKEMLFHKENISSYPANSFRAELRLLNKRKVQASLGINKGAEIAFKYNELKERRLSILKDFVFKVQPQDFTDIIINNAEKLIFAYALSDNRNWLQCLFKTYGQTTLIKEIGTENFIEIYRNALRVKGYNTDSIKSMVSRARKQVENRLPDIWESLEIDKIPYSQLYNEIYQKVLKAA